ncbi:hypothetical protein PR048_016842 [Dryococelus australis]|uniref:Uncharacterized protein n=1 Tax=Dryococelus australis TaxID=614101 RepID=A0ABQ9H8D8_9NEOP|nr:hypothetical protein PR048_016842 [Dryococelus australis]
MGGHTYVIHLCISEAVLQRLAQERYNTVRQSGEERLVSGSDDFTLFLWTPEVSKKLIGWLLSTTRNLNE